jgi:hypothetical protein
MSNAWGLTLVAIGAIFAFAISGHPSWVNLHIVGWVILLTGIAGMILKRVGYGPVRRWPFFGQSQQSPPPPPPPGGSYPAAITGTVITDQPVPGNVAPPPAPPAGEPPGGVPPGAAAPEETLREPYDE